MEKIAIGKRVAALLLAMLLVLSICGCKKAADDGSSYYYVESTIVTKKNTTETDAEVGDEAGETGEDGTAGSSTESGSGKNKKDGSTSGSTADGGSSGSSTTGGLSDAKKEELSEQIGSTAGAGYVKDLGGRTITYGFNTYFEAPDSSTKQGQATLAYYKLIEEKLNCKIVWNPKKMTDEEILAEITAGSKPSVDIYMTWGVSDLFKYAKKNYFEALDSYDVVNFSDYSTYGSDIQYGKMGGSYYGVPVNGASWAGVPLLFYNKQALKKAGYTAESLNEMQQNGTWTWDTFQQVLEKVKAATGIQKPLSDGSLYFYNMLMAGAGADWVTESNGTYTFTADSPKAVEAMDYYAKITQLGLVENVEAGDVTAVWYDINRASAGECAFWVSWEGMIEQATFPESSMWGCMYPPKKDESASYVSPNTTIQFYSVCKGVDKPAEVLTVLSEMVKPIMSESELTSSRKSQITAMVSDKYSLSNLLNCGSISTFFNTDFANAAGVVYGENKDGWNYQVAKIAAGSMPLAQAIASYKKLYNNRLAELFK